MIGQCQAFTPKFVKKYADVAQVIINAMREYCEEVRQGEFPTDDHCYRMIQGERNKYLELMKQPREK
jgi:3-methyl-2-oxobutanoate hydroxymethyltransferase